MKKAMTGTQRRSRRPQPQVLLVCGLALAALACNGYQASDEGVEASEASLTGAPLAAAGEVWASDLAWKQVSNGWGPVEKDKSNGEKAAGDGKTLTLNGKTYAKGLGCHAVSEITIPLNKAYTGFTTDVGIDDEVGANGSAVFEILADGASKFRSATLTGNSTTIIITIDVTGATTLTLKVTDGGNGSNSDHADWAGAKLTTTPQYTLATSATNGSVNLQPSGGKYNSGTTVSLSAAPAAGYAFSGWSGDLTGSANPATLTMNSNKSVTANFTALPLYQLKLTFQDGTVTTTPDGGPNKLFPAGTVVSLKATPATGYQFDNWSGDINDVANPVSVTMSADMYITANFRSTPYYRLTTAATNDGGTIEQDPAGLHFPGGTNVNLIAHANPGFAFRGWTGDIVSPNTWVVAEMNRDMKATANFSPYQYYFTVTTVATNGAVELNPPGGTYLEGTAVTLTAKANPGYEFTGWTGHVQGSGNPVTITVSGNTSVTAHFGTSTWASDLAWRQVSNAWGPVEKDRSNGEANAGDGKTLTLNGKTYAKGFGCHANSEITIPLNGKYRMFSSDYGIDDEVGSKGSAIFQVFFDGRLVFQSWPMTGNTDTHWAGGNVTGVQTLTLKVTDAGDGNNSDHADWANARLIN